MDRRQLGLQYHAQRQYGKALETFSLALAEEPNDWLLHCHMASSYLRLRMLDDAEACVRRALGLKPEAHAFYTLSEVMGERGAHLAALVAIDEALRQRPEYPTYWLKRATCLRQLSRPKDAEACCQKARALDPTDPQPLFTLAVLARERNALEEAADLLEQCLRLRPEAAYAHSLLATVRSAQGRWPEAEEACQNALKLDADSPALIDLLQLLRRERKGR